MYVYINALIIVFL